MSWLSRLFRSKNMDVEFKDIDGTVTIRRVSKRAFLPMMDKMVATGIAKKVDLCVAHIHDVMRGEYTAE